MRLILKAYETLEVGGIIVNKASTYRGEHMPYGGIKDSGMGREVPRYAIEEERELPQGSPNASRREAKHRLRDFSQGAVADGFNLPGIRVPLAGLEQQEELQVRRR